MYQPRKYKNQNQNFHFDFIQKNPFATIVINGDHLLATHVPILIEGNPQQFQLYGHLANHNPMCDFLKDGIEMLIIFHGPHTYVSSSWYEKPGISTWDYSAVHVRATVTVQNDQELEECLSKLIFHFERDQQNPVLKKDIPQDVWDEDFPDITGFWLKPKEVLGIKKWHQNFSKTDRKSVAENLRKQSRCPAHQFEEIIDTIYDTEN